MAEPTVSVWLRRIWRPGDPLPEPGSHVALACPECNWRSTESVVIDLTNGAWRAYQAVVDQWKAHWDDEHGRPAPHYLIVEGPSDE